MAPRAADPCLLSPLWQPLLCGLLPSSLVATPDSAASSAAALPSRWLLLTILTTAYGAGAFGMLGLSPLSPSLLDGFGLTRLELAFIVPSIYVGGLFFSLPGGRLADRIGVHKGYALAVVAELLAGAMSGGPTIQPGNERRGGTVNNMFTIIVDPARLAGARLVPA